MRRFKSFDEKQSKPLKQIVSSEMSQILSKATSDINVKYGICCPTFFKLIVIKYQNNKIAFRYFLHYYAVQLAISNVR